MPQEVVPGIWLFSLSSTLVRLSRELADPTKPLARDCLAIRTNSLPDDWVTFSSWSLLGATLPGQGKHVAVEPLLLLGYAGMKQCEDRIPASGKVRVTEALDRLAQLYEETDRTRPAAQWEKKSAEFDQSTK